MKHLDCVEENEEIQLVGDHTVKEIKKGASVKIVNGKLTVTGNILDNVTVETIGLDNNAGNVLVKGEVGNNVKIMVKAEGNIELKKTGSRCKLSTTAGNVTVDKLGSNSKVVANGILKYATDEEGCQVMQVAGSATRTGGTSAASPIGIFGQVNGGANVGNISMGNEEVNCKMS